MKKYLLASAFLIAFTHQVSFAYEGDAEQICGMIRENQGSLFIDMNGGGTAALFAQDNWVFKPYTELRNLVGSRACVMGEWYDRYTIEVLRVN
jgi:hypothetical protein